MKGIALGHYIANVRDLEFNILEVLDVGAVLGTGRYSELDVDTVRTILSEAARLAEGPVVESFAFADCTVSIIEPPVRKGGIAFSSSPRPYSTPIPLGPSILCPENAAKSTPSAWRSTGWCGTDWQTSSTVSAPMTLAGLPGRPRRHRTRHVGMMAEGNHFDSLVQL